MPTEPTTVTQVIEVVEVIDYRPLLTDIGLNAAYSADFLRVIAGCVVFFVIVLLCYFVYKFFRIFF